MRYTRRYEKRNACPPWNSHRMHTLRHIRLPRRNPHRIHSHLTSLLFLPPLIVLTHRILLFFLPSLHTLAHNITSDPPTPPNKKQRPQVRDLGGSKQHQIRLKSLERRPASGRLLRWRVGRVRSVSCHYPSISMMLSLLPNPRTCLVRRAYCEFLCVTFFLQVAVGEVVLL
jgi:hypothetical protein